ncbi:site-specific integrase [Halomonas sp. CKK8]|uniref:tyrosine-type recombinase/integrase n=1 Tax=Halomonas sp. CKK8 TaxID=3036127 RepID=UPI0024153524|nr:site-specific integrase [Halomonas sp. CKK8]WFM72289.1 integrase arm-type DNA-binding domain-containing protein [Halomonas sp. CKK8]
MAARQPHQKPISTDRQVAAFAPPEGQDKARCAVANKAAGGLSLYVRTDRQAKAWVYRFRLGGKLIEMTLGRYPGMKLAEARKAHTAAAKLVEQGIDPRKHREAEKARNETAWTMGEAFERWAGFYAEAPTKGGHPPTERTVAQHKGRWRLHLAPRLAKFYVRDVTRRLLIEVLEDAAGASKEEARKCLNLLRQLLDYCEDREQVDDNPAAGLTPAKIKARPGKPRDRHLSLPELRALWQAITDARHIPEGLAATAVMGASTANAIRLLILTGCRRTEVAAMRWDEVSRDAWTIPPERAKSRRAHRVYLAPLALEILREQRQHTESPFVFPSLTAPSKPVHPDSLSTAVARLQGRSRKEHDETAPLYSLPPFTTHDLRRSAATRWTEDLLAEPLLVEQMLGHAPPKLVATYNHAARWPAQKDVWKRWAELVAERIAAEPGANVVPLRG